MGDILRAIIPPLELPEPQAPQSIIEQSKGATKVAPVLLTVAAVMGFLGGCMSPGREASAPLPPPPPPNPNSAPPSAEWTPTPSFLSTASPSSSPTKTPEGGKGGGARAFNCDYALAERVGNLLHITVGGKGEVSPETHSGVMEDDGIRWWPGIKFTYRPEGGPVVVVSKSMPAGSIPASGAKIYFGAPGSDAADHCGTIARY